MRLKSQNHEKKNISWHTFTLLTVQFYLVISDLVFHHMPPHAEFFAGHCIQLSCHDSCLGPDFAASHLLFLTFSLPQVPACPQSFIVLFSLQPPDVLRLFFPTPRHLALPNHSHICFQFPHQFFHYLNQPVPPAQGQIVLAATCCLSVGLVMIFFSDKVDCTCLSAGRQKEQFKI